LGIRAQRNPVSQASGFLLRECESTAMKADVSTTDKTSVAATVAPEDVKCGDFVAVLTEIIELPSYYWFDTDPNKRDEVIRVRCIPTASGMPLKVKAICLPFVFVKSPARPYETLDVRRVQLVRLSEDYAKTIWKSLCKGKTEAACQELGK
jgi:hypothetical protein